MILVCYYKLNSIVVCWKTEAFAANYKTTEEADNNEKNSQNKNPILKVYTHKNNSQDNQSLKAFVFVFEPESKDQKHYKDESQNKSSKVEPVVHVQEFREGLLLPMLLM